MRGIIEFDGSCNPNPGGTPTYGWRFLLQDGDADEPTLIAQGSGTHLLPVNSPARTNNTAEYAGLLAGLAWAAKLAPGVYGELVVRGDSQVILNGVEKESPHKKYPHLRALAVACAGHLRDIRGAGHVVRLEWVGREKNKAADVLSRIG